MTVASIPYLQGLECRWVINVNSPNTISLNDRSNEYERYVVQEIGGLWDADIRFAADSLPDQHGEVPGAAYYGGRTITFSGYIEAPNLYRLREMQHQLKLAMFPLDEFACEIDSGDTNTSLLFNARKNAMIDGVERQINYCYRRDFMISLRMSDPRFYSAEDSSALYQPSLAAILGTTFPLTFNLVFGTQMSGEGQIATAGSAFSIINEGNFDTQPIWIFDGPLTNPTITHEETGEVMALNLSLSAGDQIVVDTATKTVYDNDGVNRFGIWRKGNHWLRLSPGGNDYIITVASFEGGTVSVTWRDAFL